MIWIAVILFLVSLLTVCKAPFYHAWLLSVAVSGLPWLFAAVSLAVCIAGVVRCEDFEGNTPAALGKGTAAEESRATNEKSRATGEKGWAAATILFSGAAFFLFSVPVVRAWQMQEPLKNGLREAFGVAAGGQGAFGKAARVPVAGSPFRLGKMFSGPLARKVPFRTLRYCSMADCSLDLDFYPSRREGPCPCVIVIHGGSWSSGHSRELPELNSRLARAGHHVAAVNYRLAPRYQSPLAVEDVRSALAFLRANAAELRISQDRFVLMGRSAGGQIALQAAYSLKDPGIRGVIAYYAPADLVWGYSAPASRFIMDSCKVLEDYLGGSYEDVPLNYHAASPVETLAAGAVPTLLLHGKNDVLVAYGHSLRLAKKLRDAGTPHYLLSFPSGTHGFDYVLDGPEGQLAAYAVGYFLQVVLKK